MEFPLPKIHHKLKKRHFSCITQVHRHVYWFHSITLKFCCVEQAGGSAISHCSVQYKPWLQGWVDTPRAESGPTTFSILTSLFFSVNVSCVFLCSVSLSHCVSKAVVHYIHLADAFIQKRLTMIAFNHVDTTQTRKSAVVDISLHKNFLHCIAFTDRGSFLSEFLSSLLQGLLVFAESTGLPMSMYFDEPGR